MNAVLYILLPVALVIVAVILLTGVTAMFKGGAFNRRYSNKLMRWRIIAQAVAIAIALLALYLTGR